MTTETKAKRGRPPTQLTPDTLHMIKIMFPDVRTRRGQLDKCYVITALGKLLKMIANGETGLEYIILPKEERHNQGILRELGKFPVESIPSLALDVCRIQAETPMSIRQWEKVLRFTRIKETVAENSEVML